MNTKFTLLAAALFMNVAAHAQQVNGQVTMGSNYANDVYYGLDGQTATVTNRADWDISFYRKSNFSTGIRVNDTKGIQVFEASNDLSTWNNINVANAGSWTELYNDDTNWQEGAFNQASAVYGWGAYDIATHFVKGTIVFVLKYTTGEYVKLKIDQLNAPSGTYSFTYAKLINGTWSTDKTVSIAHSVSPNNLFNYYNFITDSVTTPEPEQSKWDLKFTKYITPLDAGGSTVMYSVTGVLQSDLIKVAKTETGNPTNDAAYLASINTVGYDWKTFNMSSGGYTIKPTNFFIKNSTTNKIYKLNFTAFEGSATGVVKFNYENVTASLGTSDLEKTKFGVYTTNQPKTISIVYNSNQSASSNLSVQVYSMNGQLVHQEIYKPTSSFTNKTIQLSKLPAGVYVVKLQSADKVESKKVVLQ
ncbi:T9SS type A sorting domain-containing protein [Algoriella sp.]|uniref:T9SS type A sorting domain-containing protein n=1 Tax=Algoriella sp. TaxID=1872434 RepID=UPI002FCC99F9